MKFSIQTSSLMEVISKLQSVVAPRPALPLLANFMIEAKGGELTLTATDLTVGIRAILPARIEEEGATTVPARRFFQLVKELTAPQIEITTDAQQVTHIKTENSRFKLNGMDQAEFPHLPEFSVENSFKVSQKELKEVLFRTSFAVSKEESRYALTGVLMHLEEGQGVFVGTDGKRLAKSQLTSSIPHHLNGSYILPSKAVDELMKTLKDEEELSLYVENDKVAFEFDQTRIVTKLLSGEYPDFQRVIPQETKLEVVLHREELMTLLKQVSLFTGDTTHSICCTLEEGELKLSAMSSEIGEGVVSMPVHYDRERFDIAFNPNYMLDILRHTRDETVKLGLIDPHNPGVIGDSSAATFILMPMRLTQFTAAQKPEEVYA